MSTLVTFPRVSLRDAFFGLLRGIGRLDTETLRYEYGPSVDSLDPLAAAVAAAEEERAELLAALEAILSHVEDPDAERLGTNQCTLCHTYRMLGHAAVARARS